MESSEREYYKPIKTKLAEILNEKYGAYHLEITAKRFSNRLKAGIPDSRHIIFTFLKDVRPDITGFVKEDYSTKFVVVEVRNEALKVDHIYQVKKICRIAWRAMRSAYFHGRDPRGGKEIEQGSVWPSLITCLRNHYPRQVQHGNRRVR